MSETTYLIILSVIVFSLVAIAHKMVLLRIKVLNFLHLYAFANWHERHIEGVSWSVRIILTCLGLYLLYLGLSG